MANPTDQHAPPLTPMRPTPGIGQGPAAERPARGPSSSMTGAPQGPEVRGADPVLFDDLEPVHLVRLFPQAFAEGGSAADMAVEAGKAAQEQGLHLLAAQQEPLNWAIEGGPPADAPPPPPPPAPARHANRHEPGPGKEA